MHHLYPSRLQLEVALEWCNWVEYLHYDKYKYIAMCTSRPGDGR